MRRFIWNATTHAVLACLFPTASDGQVFEFEQDQAGWVAAVGEFTTVDFTGFPEFTIITDQYQDLGLLFTDGDDHIPFYGPVTFPNDGWGLRSSPTPIEMAFATPQYWIAAEFPGLIRIQLFSNGNLVYSSTNLGASGDGNFGGLVSETPFDYAIIFDPFDTNVFVDDLHFGPPPGPGDVNGDGEVNAVDLIQVIMGWGMCPDVGFCLPDTDHDDVVDVEDLITVILNWT